MAANVGKILLDKEILLESGTNELEVLVFDIAQFTFGINVAKVREVFPRPKITALAKSHPSVRGVFRLRDHVVPCVSLVDHLGIEATGPEAESTMILTDFNQQQTAFLVDRVERIHRLSWEKVMGMPPLEALRQTPVTAIVRCDNRLIVMLDFEMIIDQVTQQAYRVGAIENVQNLPRDQLRIVMCDDSPTIRQAVGATLRDSGYTRLELFENGEQAWKWIERRLAETGSAAGVADLIISDIEMPQVDGLHLTKRIKEHPQLRELPVLLYSSIVTPDNMKKGAAVGANLQISKPELNKIVEIADGLIAQHRDAAASAATLAEVANDDSRFAEDSPTEEPIPTEQTIAKSVADSPPSKPTKAKPAGKKTSARSKSSTRKATKAAAEHVPAGVNVQLWQTFLEELGDHVAALSRPLAEAAEGTLDEDGAQTLFRTLHTIKSASMVIPCEPVTRTTHAVEELLAPLRRTPTNWPHDLLAGYASWLETITNPMIDLDDVFAPKLVDKLLADLGAPAMSR